MPKLTCRNRSRAIHQAWLDEQEKDLRRRLLKEIQQYHRVQQAWGLGPLKLSRRPGILQIWARYLELEDNRVHQAFLARGSWESALQRVNHVKSFSQNKSP